MLGKIIAIGTPEQIAEKAEICYTSRYIINNNLKKGYIMRNLISNLHNNFSQGSVFNCLKLNDSQSLYGIVLTARCDIEQKKCRNVICLPIYSLNTFLQNSTDLKNYIKKDLISRLNNILKKYDYDIELFTTYGKDEIVSKIQQSNYKRKEKETAVSQIENIGKMLECIQNGDMNNIINNQLKSTIKDLSIIHTLLNGFISDIIDNKKMDLYFLESISNELKSGYIIDFNSPVSIPFEDLNDLAQKKVYKEHLNDSSNTCILPRRKKYHFFSICEESDTLSFISQINSPYIEHILQRFCFFLSRIGTEDLLLEDRQKFNFPRYPVNNKETI